MFDTCPAVSDMCRTRIREARESVRASRDRRLFEEEVKEALFYLDEGKAPPDQIVSLWLSIINVGTP